MCDEEPEEPFDPAAPLEYDHSDQEAEQHADYLENALIDAIEDDFKDLH